MVEITLTVSKAGVYDRVAMSSSYAGAKMVDDVTAYDRIFTTDADREQLESYWCDMCNAATQQFKPFLVSVNAHPESRRFDLAHDYEVVLSLSDRFDSALVPSIESSLFSYFVAGILAKWYRLTNKAEVESYANEAAGMLDDVMRKLYYKTAPARH